MNVIPLTHDYNKFGVLISDNYITNQGIQGDLYKYDHNINILVYDIKDTGFKAIVYKNNNEYFKFIDVVNKENNNFIRIIKNNSIFINNNEITHIETKLNSKLIETQSRDIKKDDRMVTFDIECYLEKIDESNSKFTQYSCC